MKEITYHFIAQGKNFRHTVSLSEEEPYISAEDQPPAADWTLLKFQQCENCHYSKTDRCPVAVQLQGPVALLEKFVSHEKVEVTVETPERSYHKITTAEEALSSLFGLVMARSGCPAFDGFRGLAWFHLPFASYEESLFRIASSYLLRQYLLEKRLKTEEEIISGIKSIYDTIYKVNRGIFRRIQIGYTAQCDSPYNAIVLLDSMGSMVAMSIEDGLDEIKDLFH